MSDVIDKGNGIKVAVQMPTGAMTVEQRILLELQSINAKLTWFVILSVIGILASLFIR